MDLPKCILSTLLLMGISYVLPQDTNLNDLIENIFNNDDPNQVQQSEKYKSCGKEKVCVPKYLCKNGEINTDGTGLIDTRAGGPIYVTNGTNINDIPRKKKEISSKNSRSSQCIEDTECGNFEICCKIPKEPNLTTLPMVNVGCDYLNPNGLGYRITEDDNANNAQFGESTWMVTILREILDPAGEVLTIYKCGGALIAPTVVITAAHCVENIITQTLIVRAAQINNEILQHQNRRVRKVILHEKFNQSTLLNDIALIVLESPYDSDENIRPICLTPEDTHFDLYRCHIIGWYKDCNCRIAGKTQVILKKFDLPVMLRNQYHTSLRITRLGKYFNLYENFICAAGELGKGSCNRDGGSVLICPIADKDGQFNHAGIAAWSIGCGKDSIHGEYVNVAYLHQWIKEKLSTLETDLSDS